VDTRDKTPARRKNGTFLPGSTGNRQGRPKGSKNRITLLKHAMEQQLREQMEGDMAEVVKQMMTLAKQGDKDMIKLAVQLHVSKAGSTDEKDAKDKVEININSDAPPEIRSSSTPPEAIEAEFEEINHEKDSKRPV
jgi:hypothetical protein